MLSSTIISINWTLLTNYVCQPKQVSCISSIPFNNLDAAVHAQNHNKVQHHHKGCVNGQIVITNH
jgi:hypothetical protein